MKKTIVIFLVFFSTFIYSQSLVRDNSFGNSGIVNTNYHYNSSPSAIYRLILLNDHKFICYGAKKIVRFNENGTIDNSFGLNGEFQIPSTPAGQYFGINNVQLIDGNFYLSGSIWYSNNNTYDAFLIKLTFNGTIDTTFGSNGCITYHINENEIFNQIAITSDSKIIAVGIKRTYDSQKLFITRFNANGSIDTTFQNNGYKEIYVFPIATEEIQNMSKIENNKFIIACTGKMDVNSPYKHIALVKLDTDGNFDLTFNTSGTYISTNYNTHFDKVKFFDNKIYYAGTYNTYNAILYKIDLLNLNAQTGFFIDRGTKDYFIHDDQSISTLSNNVPQVSTYPRNLFIKKYNSNGNLENSFYYTGIYEFNLSDINNYNTDDWPSSLIIYDDKILVCGQSQLPHPVVNELKCVFTRFNQTPILSTDSFQNEKINLSPNPATDLINVSLKNISQPAYIKIFNQIGQVVFESKIDKNEIQINIDNLKSSIYFLKIIDDKNNLYSSKFIKK